MTEIIDEEKDPIHIQCTGRTSGPLGTGEGLLEIQVFPIPVETLRGLGVHLGRQAYEYLKAQGLNLAEPVETAPNGSTAH
jgi:hypothetical protein